METSNLTKADNWFWCPRTLNPADLLVLLWKNSTPVLATWQFPIPPWRWMASQAMCLPHTKPAPTSTVNRAVATPFNSLTDLIMELLERNQSYTKVFKSLCNIQKGCRNLKQSVNQLLPCSKIRNTILYSIISYFTPQAVISMAKNKLKHLVIQALDGIYYMSDRSFRSRMGDPLISGKIILAQCIVWDAYDKLGHGKDVLQILSSLLTEFTRVRSPVVKLKKICRGCLKLNKSSFSTKEVDMPDILKTIQQPFCYCQADIFGLIFGYNVNIQLKQWVLVILCLSSQAVHLKLLHSYNAQSLPEGSRDQY